MNSVSIVKINVSRGQSTQDISEMSFNSHPLLSTVCNQMTFLALTWQLKLPFVLLVNMHIVGTDEDLKPLKGKVSFFMLLFSPNVQCCYHALFTDINPLP